MGKVYRTQLIEGVTVPSIIHNMNYFWNNMAVYQDGTVNCWQKVPMDMINDVMERGWLVFRVPEGENLSVFELGNFPIEKAEWKFDKAGYLSYIEQTICSINPKMENIHKTTLKEKETYNRSRSFGMVQSTPYKKEGNVIQNLLDGKTANIFYRKEELILTSITAYQDKTLQIDAAGEDSFQLEDIETMFQEGILCIRPEPGQWVTLGTLGKVLMGEPKYYVKSDEKLEMIRNMAISATGEQDALDKCQRAYFEYLKYPSDWTREELRKTYEAVPESQRMYLGDMDTKDGDFIRILYRPDQKREV